MRVEALGFKLWGLGLKKKALGFRLWGLGFYIRLRE